MNNIIIITPIIHLNEVMEEVKKYGNVIYEPYIKKNELYPVCGNTYRMLKQTRLSKHFDFDGDFSNHLGIFDGCGTNLPFEDTGECDPATGCC